MRNSGCLKRRLNGALLGLMMGVASLCGVGVDPATAAAPESYPKTVVAVTGINGSLYSRTLSDLAWTNLRGYLIASPAVAIAATPAGEIIHYVGIGGNGMLYQRTQTTPWRRLTTLDYRCTEVSVTATTGNQIRGACTASNQALYSFSFDGSSASPTASLLTKITANGSTFSRATILPHGSDLPFFWFRGPEYGEQGSVANIWQVRSDGVMDQYPEWVTVAPVCNQQGAYTCAYQRATGVLTIGVEDSLYYDIPCISIGSPALTPSHVFVTGGNQAIYYQALDDNSLAWTKIPAMTNFGPTAVSAGGL